MGDPKKNRKRYSAPADPWEADRIKRDKELRREYGLRNMRELWRINSLLSKYKRQAKKCAAGTTEQLEKEKKQLLDNLSKYGLLPAEASLDDVLGLTVENLLDRRLQTLVYKKKLAGTIRQARQLIVHGHVMVDGKKVTVPSYMMTLESEGLISINPVFEKIEENAQ